MQIEFTVDISSLEWLGVADCEGRIDRSGLVDLARAAEGAGIERLLIADRTGGKDATSLASYILHATGTLGVEVEHRAGSLAPEIAARQLATLDQLSGGRVSVRIAPPNGDATALSHEERFALLDEYLVLLKRLWANDKPIDHEGRFHRLRSAFSGAKPFGSGSVPLVLAGASGTAVNVAARHADVFVLPAATVEETRRTIERVKAAAARHRRADAIRFALPVRPSAAACQYGRAHPFGQPVGWPSEEKVHKIGGTEFSRHQPIEAAVVAGSPEKIALALIDYCEIGVTDFVVAGLRTVAGISAFGTAVAQLVRRALARHRANPGDELRTGLANPAFARWSHYPA
jgi:alkanesulfonate monooxygenase